jgi:Fur family ferric uptake transcriptional regulator
MRRYRIWSSTLVPAVVLARESGGRHNRAMTAAPVTPRADAAVAALRARRERVTPARTAVLEILDHATDHLTADDVSALATARAPGVHRATVYRALATLTELGLVTHVHLGGAATVYHLAGGDPAASEHPAGHAHLQCTTCKDVIDVPITTMTALVDRLDRDHGFRLEPERTALLGTCARCRS